MLVITESIHIPDEELEFSYARSGGPGGQNVNKVASKVVLRWRASRTSTHLSEQARQRMRSRYPSRYTTAGDVVISSQRFRDRERNRQDCLDKLVEMIRASLVEPIERKTTRPSAAARSRRLTEKKRHSAKKQSRRASEES